MTKKTLRPKETLVLGGTNIQGLSKPNIVKSHTMTPQQSRVLERLRKGPLNKVQAIRDLNIFTLAQIICALRKSGYKIETRRAKFINGAGGPSWYAEYILQEKEVKNG